jgi:geranylgeranyl reductase family protein
MGGIYDCIVIGGGPGGSTAAYHLARLGRSVLLLDKAQFPRRKPCGGGVSPQVAQWLPFDLKPAISTTISSLSFTWLMGTPLVVDLGTCTPLWMVHRDRFDQIIVDQAASLGVELREAAEATGLHWQSDRWVVDTPAGSEAGRYVIGADGALGKTAKALGFTRLKHLPAAALEGETLCAMTDSHTAHLDFGSIPNGYQWAFPKADGWSVGSGIFRGKPVGDLRSAFGAYCRAFRLDPEHLHPVSHPIKLWDGAQTLHTQNALLVGEAACLVDPFTAEGIRPSVLSGCLAADSVHAALMGKDRALEDYSRRIQADWGAEMVWAKRLAQVFYRTPLLSYRLGVERPGAAKRMAQILSGEVRYSEVARGAIASLTKGMF